MIITNNNNNNNNNNIYLFIYLCLTQRNMNYLLSTFLPFNLRNVAYDTGHLQIVTNVNLKQPWQIFHKDWRELPGEVKINLFCKKVT